MSKFEVGDSVVQTYNERITLSSNKSLGKIVSVMPGEKYGVMNKYGTQTQSGNNLILESEFDEKKAGLEAAFENVKAQLETKVAEASKALGELADIAEAAGFELGNDEGGVVGGPIYKVVAPLMRAIDDCGWSSSSIGC